MAVINFLIILLFAVVSNRLVIIAVAQKGTCLLKILWDKAGIGLLQSVLGCNLSDNVLHVLLCTDDNCHLHGMILKFITIKP